MVETMKPGLPGVVEMLENNPNFDTSLPADG
jgi:hypothetical protein